MEFEEFSGKTVDEALTEAAIKLQTTSDSLEVEVMKKSRRERSSQRSCQRGYCERHRI